MLKKFISYYKPHLGLFTLDTICALLIAGIDLLFPLGTRYILNANNLAEIKETNTYMIIVYIGIGLLFLYIIKMFLSYIIAYWGHIMGARIERDMRLDLFKHFQELDYQFFDENKTGVLMSNLTNHLHDISEMSHHVPEDLITSICMFIGSFIILLSVNINLTLILFVFIIFVVIFTAARRKRQMAAFKATRVVHGELNSQIESSIAGIRLTRAYNNEEFEINKFQKVNIQYEQSWDEAYREMGIYASGNAFLLSLLNLVVLVAGALFVVFDKGVDTTDLLTYFLYISFLTSPIHKLVNSMQQTQQGFSGFSKFYQLMNTHPVIVSKEDAIVMKNPKGDIKFNNATFSYYQNSEHVLKDFTLHVEAGKRIAIIGETGVGKSTISKLIPRFYELNSGTILIDDVDIKDYELNSLRDSIGHVQQDVYIFYGTIKENILYGAPDATDEQIYEADKKANIHDFIESLENGYDTLTGERGVKLSGGQKQRIAIARLFLKQPKILILDEATSALDNETERIVQKAFDTLAVDKTIIIIAHRLSTIRNADEIIVLGKEGIIERGNHEELLQKNGKYASLLQK